MAASKAKSLSERMAELANPEPECRDPDDELSGDTAARVDDHFEQEDGEDSYLERGRLRTAAAGLLLDEDTKYVGKKTSRKAMKNERGGDDIDEREHMSAELGDMFFGGPDDEESEEDEESEGDEEEDEVGDEEESEEDADEDIDGDETEDDTVETADKEGDELVNGQSADVNGFSFPDDGDFSKYGDVEDDDEEDSGDDDDSGEEGENTAAQLEFSEISLTKRTDEVARGRAVKRQLETWDKLLEARIGLQKVLAKANRFPQPDAWAAFTAGGDAGYQDLLAKNRKCLTKLLGKLLELQHLLQDGGDGDGGGTGTAEPPPPSKKPRLSELGERLRRQHEAEQLARDQTIQKWNDRTRVAAGKLDAKSFGAFESSTLKQIEQILADRARLVGRTQLKRSVYEVLGKEGGDTGEEEEERDQEIFDDDDFYHQLLRELIDRKTNNVSDPHQLGRQWLEIQKLRTRLKKKVDTKASKGRKMRYDIHAKLVNFMAPVYSQANSFNDQAKNELFASLFGNKKS